MSVFGVGQQGASTVSRDNAPSRAGRSEKMRAIEDDASQDGGALVEVIRDGSH